MELLLVGILMLIVLPIIAIKILLFTVGSIWEHAGTVFLVLIVLFFYSCSKLIS